MLLSLVVACGDSMPAAGAPLSGNEFIAAVRDHKCAKCHAPPEPATRTREQLEEAFARHGKRVHLTAAQWQAMTEYLAAPQGAAAGQER